MLVDLGGMGLALANLASLYQGLEMPMQPQSRLTLAAAELRGSGVLPSSLASGAKQAPYSVLLVLDMPGIEVCACVLC